MRLLKYAGEPERGVWRPMNGDQIARWREKVLEDLNNTSGRIVRYEHDEAYTRGLEVAERAGRDTAVLEKPTREKPREPRETAELLAKDIADQWLLWRRTNPDLFWSKIREAKSLGGLGHLTDEQAAEHITALCRKIAEQTAKETYERTGIGRREWYQGGLILE